MLIRYARGSTADQNPDHQIDALLRPASTMAAGYELGQPQFGVWRYACSQARSPRMRTSWRTASGET